LAGETAQSDVSCGADPVKNPVSPIIDLFIKPRRFMDRIGGFIEFRVLSATVCTVTARAAAFARVDSGGETDMDRPAGSRFVAATYPSTDRKGRR
jgi:hypothetical protein